MDLNKLLEIEEYAAYGFYEAEDKPYPFAYAHAFRRCYEMEPVRLLDEYILVPAEPDYMSGVCFGDTMGGGKKTFLRGLDPSENYTYHSQTKIFGHEFCYGLTVNLNTAEQKKQMYPQYASFIDELCQDLTQKTDIRRSGFIHNNPDIITVVRKGFLYMIDEIEEEIKKAQQEQDQEGLDYLYAMQDYAQGVLTYYQKHLAALEQAVKGAQGERKQKLSVILEEYRNCFLKPSTTFVSGLLAINLCWMLDGCDSIGRVDYALGDLLEKDLAEGTISIAFARELLDNFWIFFERYHGWNLQIGGVTPEGTECYNLLTEELLRCNMRHKTRRPNLSLRVTKNMPHKIWDLALESIACGNGKPALYHDELYIETLRKYLPDIEEQDLCMYGLGGCTETMITGMSCVDSLGGSLSLDHCLMAALFNGKNVYTGRKWGLETGEFQDFETFEDFLAALKKQIDFGVEGLANAMNEYVPISDDFKVRRKDDEIGTWGFTDGLSAKASAENAEYWRKAGDPRIVRSMFTRGCTANRKPFDMGGAKYNWCVVSFWGTTILTDSLAAIKKCVFDEKKISKETLIEALKCDFRGYEDVQRLLKNAEKFGNDIEWVDKLGSEMIDYTWNQVLQKKYDRGGIIVPSVILFNTYEEAGKDVPALPNGRNAGKPSNDSIGAFEGADENGPTALINSVVRLPQTKAFGTPVFNMRFGKQLFESTDGREKVMYLLKSYFAQGGMQAQISVLSTEEMRAAQKEPEKYKDLIVRIGGYSEFFVYLSPALQETVIHRSEQLA